MEQQSTSSELYGKMQAVFIEMDTAPTVCIVRLIALFVCLCIQTRDLFKMILIHIVLIFKL